MMKVETCEKKWKMKIKLKQIFSDDSGLKGDICTDPDKICSYFARIL